MNEQAERIRILCIDNSVGFGGATKSMGLMLREMRDVDAVILTSQTRALRDQWYSRHQIHVFRSFFNYRSRARLAEWLSSTRLPDWARRVIARAYVALDFFVSILGAVRIWWIVRRNEIQLIHLANGVMPEEAFLAGRLSKVPVIAHLRGFYDGSSALIMKHSVLPALVIGDSYAVSRSFQEKYSHDVQVETIHEAVDLSAFSGTEKARTEVRQRLKLGEESIAVGIFGRVIPWKGQREFVRATLEAMRQNPRIVGVIVGDSADGAKSYFDEVKELIRSSGMGEGFRLTGYVSDVEPYYSAMDVVVHASVEPEPCGMVVLEAMAAGRPVIATNDGGPPELIRNGVDGHLVPPADVKTMARSILQLADDAALRHRMGEAGRARVRSKFDVPIAEAKLRSIYDRLISTNAL